MFFFFQAEDGIRDLTVTGVQTCALPISSLPGARIERLDRDTTRGRGSVEEILTRVERREIEIGRASCRGRGEISVGAVSLKKKKKKSRRGWSVEFYVKTMQESRQHDELD